jgi:hypothetical protein
MIVVHVCQMHRTVPCIPLSVTVTTASAKIWPKDTPARAYVLITHRQEDEALPMGRTVPTYRTVLEALIKDWQNLRRALRKEDREAFGRMISYGRSRI